MIINSLCIGSLVPSRIVVPCLCDRIPVHGTRLNIPPDQGFQVTLDIGDRFQMIQNIRVCCQIQNKLDLFLVCLLILHIVGGFFLLIHGVNPPR